MKQAISQKKHCTIVIDKQIENSRNIDGYQDIFEYAAALNGYGDFDEKVLKYWNYAMDNVIYSVKVANVSDMAIDVYGYADSLGIQPSESIDWFMVSIYKNKNDVENIRNLAEKYPDNADMKSILKEIDDLQKFQGYWVIYNRTKPYAKIKVTDFLVEYSSLESAYGSSGIGSVKANVLQCNNLSSIRFIDDKTTNYVFGRVDAGNGSIVYRTYEARKVSQTAYENQNYKSEPIKTVPKLGMTEDEAMNTTWGTPKKKNTTTNKYGTSEQWVFYGNRYLYLDDGIVTSIQDSIN